MAVKWSSARQRFQCLIPMGIRRPQLTTAFVLVAMAIITACPHATPATSHQPAPDAVGSAGITSTNPGPPHAFDVSGSYDDGAGCRPHGDLVELKGVIVVEPFGKGIDGARLVAADGERWILNYGARGVYRELDGKRVTARGRACDMQGEAIMGRHFDPATLTVD
ncbi:hypothetical protein [Nannocystis pusilla]|uniref:Lipoprotein n=1 Tax=Nannocystis pusilla TaxID=889268 RepID=A0ABS7TQI1_9BACT|nr:hypothetical protein [Nannocystis pusilla]MBZ5710480.1 hypothetical protein [Nannocystis pusilla]